MAQHNSTEFKMRPLCTSCGDPFAPARRRAGYTQCMPCGERTAVSARSHWCIAPLHKSNYVLITDENDLKGINNKGGLHR